MWERFAETRKDFFLSFWMYECHSFISMLCLSVWCERDELKKKKKKNQPMPTYFKLTWFSSRDMITDENLSNNNKEIVASTSHSRIACNFRFCWFEITLNIGRIWEEAANGNYRLPLIFRALFIHNAQIIIGVFNERLRAFRIILCNIYDFATNGPTF